MRHQIANIRWIIEKAREFQKNTYFCFINYTKTFACVDHNKLWKILQEMWIPDHLICLVRNVYADQEAMVRIRYGAMDWFQIGKRVCQGCILSLCSFNLYAVNIVWNARIDEAQAWIRLLGEISITSGMRLDLMDRVPDEWWIEVCDIVQEAVIKTNPEKKKCKNKAKLCLGRPYKWLRKEEKQKAKE